MIDVEALLQNLISLQLNSHVCANHHRIRQIVVKGENGAWTASRRFPRTVLDFVTLTRRFIRDIRDKFFGYSAHTLGPDMLSLQNFYNIQLDSVSPLSHESLPCGVDNLLFVEIAREFGLSFWLENQLPSDPEYNV